MSTANDGDHAFPQLDMMSYPDGSSYITHEGGMSLRDYTAIKAMQALLRIHYAQDIGFAITAEDSYRMADTMLRAREAS